MYGTAILLILVAIWILINTFNGNLPGLVLGTTQLNNPFVGTNPPTYPNAPTQAEITSASAQNAAGVAQPGGIHPGVSNVPF